jgi:DNA polymerase III sliding clamp (beta) subunit (PCNA family)
LLQIGDPNAPGIIRPVGDSEDYLHVIMPMYVAR